MYYALFALMACTSLFASSIVLEPGATVTIQPDEPTAVSCMGAPASQSYCRCERVDGVFRVIRHRRTYGMEMVDKLAVFNAETTVEECNLHMLTDKTLAICQRD